MGRKRKRKPAKSKKRNVKRKKNVSNILEILIEIFALIEKHFPRVDDDVDMEEEEEEEGEENSLFLEEVKSFKDTIDPSSDLKAVFELLIINNSTSSALKKSLWDQCILWLNKKMKEILDYSAKFERDNICPITQTLMKIPVMLKQSAQCFDQESLVSSLKSRLECPLTRKQLEEKENIEDHFFVNREKRDAIAEYKERFAREGVYIVNILNEMSVIEDEGVINLGIAILEKLKEFEILEENVVFMHEKLLTIQNGENGDGIVAARIDIFLYFYSKKDKRKETMKYYLDVLKSEVDDMNPMEKKRVLEPMVAMLHRSRAKGLLNLLKKVVVSLMYVYKALKELNRAKELFEKYKKNFFDGNTSEVLILKLCFLNEDIHESEAVNDRRNKVISKIKLKIASVCFNEKKFELAEKYVKESLDRNASFGSLKLLIRIYKGVKKSDIVIAEACYNLANFCKDNRFKSMNGHYLGEAFKFNPENEEIKRDYLSYLLDSNQFEKFKEVTNQGVEIDVLVNKIDEFDKRFKTLKKKIEDERNWKEFTVLFDYEDYEKIVKGEKERMRSISLNFQGAVFYVTITKIEPAYRGCKLSIYFLTEKVKASFAVKCFYHGEGRVQLMNKKNSILKKHYGRSKICESLFVSTTIDGKKYVDIRVLMKDITLIP